MNTSTLIGSTVTEAEIMQVPAVPFTNTFHPVHHKHVIDAVRDGVSLSGLGFVRSEYALAREGMQMFAVWDLNTGNDDLCWSLGIRNSMNLLCVRIVIPPEEAKLYLVNYCFVAMVAVAVDI